MIPSDRLAAPLAGLAALALGACALSQPHPAKAYFAVDAPAPAPSETARRDENLRVARARIAPPFDDVAYHYLVAPGRYESDYYVNFVAAPARLITASLIAWLQASGPYAHVVDSTSPVGTSATLQCDVTALYADYTDESAPAGVVEATFFLLDESGVDARVLLQRTYRERVPMEEEGSMRLTEAWNTALARIFSSIAGDLGKLP